MSKTEITLEEWLATKGLKLDDSAYNTFCKGVSSFYQNYGIKIKAENTVFPQLAYPILQMALSKVISSKSSKRNG